MADPDSDSEQFELVDAQVLAKEILEETKPDLPKIIAWLCPTDYDASSSEFRRHLSSQAVGTGHWIRETVQFQQWYESGQHGSLWIKAAPGAGKSVVAASLVDSLVRNKNHPVLHFFFRQIVETNRSSRSLIKDFLVQILPHSELLQVSLWDIVSDDQDLSTISDEQLWKLLLRALKHLEKVYLIVDALDEMDYNESFLSRLDTLGAASPSRIKVLMTSRPKQYLQKAIKNPQVIHFSLEEELINRDISVYVQHRMRANASLPFTESVRDTLQQTICRRCRGLFLYARLILDQIFQAVEEQQLAEDQLLSIVEQLPVGLEEMYNTMLTDHSKSSGISPATQMLILQFVTQSARPLRLIELSKAVEASTCPQPSGMNSKDIVRLSCGPLLEVMEDEVVQILHHSFTEFLLDDSRAERGATQFPVVEPHVAHRAIALTCFNRIYDSAFKDFEVDASTKTGQHHRSSSYFAKAYLRYPLLKYATQYWTYHARNCDFSGPDLPLLEAFCSLDNPCYHAWVHHTTNFTAGRRRAFDINKLTYLHIAACYGLASWTEHLVAGGADVDALDSTENSPLIWAIEENYTKIVKTLLGAGAEPDIAGRSGLKPLHKAASANHFQIVKLLVEAGVSPTTPKMRETRRTSCGWRRDVKGHPLMFACQKGNTESVIEMLPYVDQNADLESALCWAAESGHHEVLVAILDNTDVSANARLQVELSREVDTAEGFPTALMLAVRALSPSCVRTLLQRGADVQLTSSAKILPFQDRHTLFPTGANLKPIHGLAGMKISEADAGAFNEILVLLLGAGASLEDREPLKGDTPFLCAVYPSSRRVAKPQLLNPYPDPVPDTSASDSGLLASKLLAVAGADTKALNREGENLLHKFLKFSAASVSGLKDLLELGLDPRVARYSDGATPLHCAMRCRRSLVEYINVLVEHGADVNAKDYDGNTPLHLVSNDAAAGRHDFISMKVKALVESGANVNAQNNLGESVLHVTRLRPAPNSDVDEQLKCILDAGADLEIYDRAGRTPLLAALAAGNITFLDEVAKQSSVNIHARVRDTGKTALHLACAIQTEPEKAVQKLVDLGCDPLVVDDEGNSLLHEAARFQRSPRDMSLVERLISLGVPVCAVNRRGRTAVHVMPPYSLREASSLTAQAQSTMVETFLQKNPNFNINTQDDTGYTPLHLAAAACEVQTFCLLKAGANPLLRAHSGRIALHCAARARQCNIVAMLVDFARDTGVLMDSLKAIDELGRTPLWYACASGRAESVRILLDAGADPRHIDSPGLPTLLACTEFDRENQLWEAARAQRIATKELEAGKPSKQATPAADPEDDLQHDTCRVDRIFELMVDAGADISDALEAVALDSSIDQTHAGNVHWELIKPENHSPSGEDLLDQASAPDPIWGKTIHSWLAHGTNDKVTKVIMTNGLSRAPSLRLGTLEAASGSSGKPLLHFACERSLWNMEMIELLVERGSVDVNGHRQIKSSSGDILEGDTALHVLARGKNWWNIEAIRYLVKHGADVNALNKDSHTPLEVACSARDRPSWAVHGLFRPRCAEVLLQLGADPDRVDEKGLVPLNKAGRSHEFVELLLKYGAGVNMAQRSLIVTAVECADVALLKLYLKHGGDPSIVDCSEERGRGWEPRSDHWYPLLIATMPPSYNSSDADTATEMMRLLLDYGARVDVPVHGKDTLIHYLFERCTTAWLRAFIERRDIDMNIRDQSGRNVFLAACSCKAVHEKLWNFYRTIQADEKERLIAEYVPSYLALADSPVHGPKIDYLVTDNEGRHLWHYQIKSNRKWTPEQAQRLLLIPGARELIRQRDNAGFLPLHLALKNPISLSSLCELFIADSPTDLLEPDPNGDSALHHIIRRQQWDSFGPLAERYLALGGDINARNDLGESPLHVLPFTAVFRDDRLQRVDEPLDFLVERGIDLLAVTNDGSTVLHLLARKERGAGRPPEKRNRIVELFKRFVDLGCDPLAEDAVGMSALDVAAGCLGTGILGLYQRAKVDQNGLS